MSKNMSTPEEAGPAGKEERGVSPFLQREKCLCCSIFAAGGMLMGLLPPPSDPILRLAATLLIVE